MDKALSELALSPFNWERRSRIMSNGAWSTR